MNTGDWISAALNIIQIAAIVIGALWAYYKFFKGRIFHRRAEPTVEASLVTATSSYAVRVRVSLENTGSTDVPLRVTLLTLAAHSAGDVDEDGYAQWRDVARAHAFCDDSGKRDHDEVESQETITDDVLIPLPPDNTPEREVFAYRVTCQVYERRNGEGGIVWTTKTIVPVERSTHMNSQGRADEEEVERREREGHGELERQRETTEEEIKEAERGAEQGESATGQREADEDEIKGAERKGS